MSVEQQMMMRHNVEQAHDAITDLDGWLNEVGKRDANLRGVAAPSGKGGSGSCVIIILKPG